MSILPYLFDSRFKQRTDIELLKHAANTLRRRGAVARKELRARIEDLEDEVAELTLLCRALLTVLRQSGAVDPAEFDAAVRAIDAEDGTLDGKVTRPRKKKVHAPGARRS